MIRPLDPDEDSRLLLTLSPNGTPLDYIEVRLTRFVNAQKIELRQMRPNPNRTGEVEKQRSVYLTQENLRELLGLDAQ